jgi:diguanylate cyclase (GGDEF)-like protein/PAS domain S-box-containing protein
MKISQEKMATTSPTLINGHDPRHPGDSWNVLVIDDEIGIGESLRLILKNMGYQVTYVDNGEEGIRLLQERPFDLVISDLVMEEINGYDILDFVQQEKFDLPVIVLTGLDSVEAAVRALKLGAYDYILKPFELDSFKKSVCRAMEKRQLESIRHLQQHRLDAIASIARAATSTLKLDEIFSILIRKTSEFVMFDQAALLVLNTEEQEATLFKANLQGEPVWGEKESFNFEHPWVSEWVKRNLTAAILTGKELSSWTSVRPLFRAMEACLLIPLITKEQLVGGLLFGASQSSQFNQEDLDFLVPIANQISVAIDNVRLLELELRRLRQLEIIHQIGRQLTTTLSLEELQEKSVALLKKHFQFQQVDIFRYDAAARRLSRIPMGESKWEPDEEVLYQAAYTGQLSTRPYSTGLNLDSESNLAQMGVPLQSETGVLGVLSILGSSSLLHSIAEKTVLESITLQISLAWDNARLFEQTCHSKNYLELILTAAEDTAIITFNPSGQVITFNSGAEKILNMPASAASHRLIQELIPNEQIHEILREIIQHGVPDFWESEICLDFAHQKRAWVNVNIRSIEPSSTLFVGFLMVMTDITTRVELNQKLTQLTVTDDLTGLYNQRFFFEQVNREIERAERRNAPLTLGIFDIDKFKQLNDAEGHLAGDEILSTLGSIVANTIRTKIDSAFRYGGDEFILLLPETNLSQAVTLMERLQIAVQQRLDGRITISAGISEYKSGLAGRDLIDTADKLLYCAKRKGGNLVIVEGKNGESE